MQLEEIVLESRPESEQEATYTVIFQPSGRRGQFKEDTTLLQAARELGVGITSVCGGKGVCGKCRVRIDEGRFGRESMLTSPKHLSPVTAAEIRHLKPDDLETHHRLACMSHLKGDVVVFIPEENRAEKQVVRKAATERAIAVKPAVRKYYVELPLPTLHEPTGDLERLLRQLHAEHGLAETLDVDYLVLRDLQAVVREGKFAVTVTVWMNREIIRVEPGFHGEAYGLAVDIGTTTVVGFLTDLATGRVLATDSSMNPQTAYGEDVMARITYAVSEPDGLEKLHDTVIACVNGLLEHTTAAIGITPLDVSEVVLVGNTAIHHLVLNLPPRALGISPFPPTMHRAVDVKARDLGVKMCPSGNVHVLPVEAGFVGADNVAVLIAEEPYNQDRMQLIIDVGTNGELVLGSREWLCSSSCATGPALEGAHIAFGMRAAPGAIERVAIDPETFEVYYKVIPGVDKHGQVAPAKPRGICGSGVIDIVAELFRVGLILKTGNFSKEIQTPRLRQDESGKWEYVLAWAEETSIGRDITFSISDIRAVQLAKGAIHCGIKLMMHKMGVERLDNVILAGAFGSYIDKEKAMIIGMFPDCPLEDVYSVGNAAGDGARIALLNVDKRHEAQEIARKVQYIEITVEEDFQREFMEALHFPHMVDPYPHIQRLLVRR